MKKILILSALFAIFTTGVTAQNYMLVDSQEIYKSLPDYAAAVEQLDVVAKEYQEKIDAAFKKIGEQYDNYVAAESNLSEDEKQYLENQIIDNEKKVTKYQEDVFGQDGEVSKKQIELLNPIQEKVKTVINNYAKENGFDLVLDISSNPMVLYYSPKANKTEQIINLLK